MEDLRLGCGANTVSSWKRNGGVVHSLSQFVLIFLFFFARARARARTKVRTRPLAQIPRTLDRELTVARKGVLVQGVLDSVPLGTGIFKKGFFVFALRII